MLDGIYKIYYQNGQLMIDGGYHKDKLAGLYKSYSSDGKIEIDNYFIEGYKQWLE